MKAILQRAKKASVLIEGSESREIGAGLVIFLGVMHGDSEAEAMALAKKAAELRIFSDENDKMNLSAIDLKGDCLVISNFTLGADCSHGRRPYFANSASPDIANILYELFVSELKKQPIGSVQTGEFGASMEVSLINDGPVTIILDTSEFMPK